MTFMNATNLRKNLFESLAQVVEFNDRIRVNIKNHNVVILSEKEYNSMMETLHLTEEPVMKERLEKGLKADIADCEEFQW